MSQLSNFFCTHLPRRVRACVPDQTGQRSHATRDAGARTTWGTSVRVWGLLPRFVSDGGGATNRMDMRWRAGAHAFVCAQRVCICLVGSARWPKRGKTRDGALTCPEDARACVGARVHESRLWEGRCGCGDVVTAWPSG